MTGSRFPDSFERLCQLMDDGFAVVDVDSTDRHVVVTVSDGRTLRAVALGPDEALQLLESDESAEHLVA